MAPLSRQVGHFAWHIVIEQKLQAPGPAIRSATSASISVRWSRKTPGTHRPAPVSGWKNSAARRHRRSLDGENSRKPATLSTILPAVWLLLGSDERERQINACRNVACRDYPAQDRKSTLFQYPSLGWLDNFFICFPFVLRAVKGLIPQNRNYLHAMCCGWIFVPFPTELSSTTLPSTLLFRSPMSILLKITGSPPLSRSFSLARAAVNAIHLAPSQ